MNIYPIFLSFVTFLSTLSGGLLASRYRKKFGFVIAFVSGVLISTALIGILPETINVAEKLNMPIKNIMYTTVLGFIFLLVIDRYYSIHRVCEDNVCRYIHNPKGGLFGAIGLSLDSFMDGLTIGIGFQFNFKMGTIFALATIAEDFSDGINTIAIMLNSGNSLKSSLKMLILNAIAPILGVISTMFVIIPEKYIVLIVPFFAGGILYMGASDLLPEAYEDNPIQVSFLYSMAGFIFVFILEIFLG